MPYLLCFGIFVTWSCLWAEAPLLSLDHSHGSRTNQRVFFLASANLSPCHKTMEENPIYLPEPGASDLPVSRKALIFDETIEQVMQ